VCGFIIETQAHIRAPNHRPPQDHRQHAGDESGQEMSRMMASG
jgi:hypothetical protein